jgi:hypothetical protein
LLHVRLLNRKRDNDPDLDHEISALGEELRRIEVLVRKAQSLDRVKSKQYAGDLTIIDLHDGGTEEREQR